MEKIDILLWVVVFGFSLMFCLMLVMLNSICAVRDKIKAIREDIKNIERRLWRIEGAMASKDCCILKEEKPLKIVGAINPVDRSL